MSADHEHSGARHRAWHRRTRALERAERERDTAGELSYDLNGLREIVEG